MGKLIDVSIVILNFNTKELTVQCLKSVFASQLGEYVIEVIVCDNSSTDGSKEEISRAYPKITYIYNTSNRGFAAGNNPGIKKSKGRYVLLLNSDTEVSPTALREMIQFMDTHLRAGAATCKLLLPNGAIDMACHRGFPNPWVAFTYLSKLDRLLPHSKMFSEYHQGYKDLSVAHTVDCISGAFFMVRKEVIVDVGLLDESFFMYGEDIDWSYRIRKSGWDIWFVPSSTTLHKKKQSGRSNMNAFNKISSEIYFHENNWLFYKKHYEKSYPFIVSFVIACIYSVRIQLLKLYRRTLR